MALLAGLDAHHFDGVGLFLAFGLAQLVYGPWADMAGRKLPIYVGLTIFLVASVFAAAALPTVSATFSNADAAPDLIDSTCTPSSLMTMRLCVTHCAG